MSNLLVEVDEALKQERMEKFWTDYGPLIITGIAALIIGTAGWSGYKAWNTGVKIEQTDKFISAVKSETSETSLLQLAPEIRPSLGNISKWRAAGQMALEGKTAEAVKIYSEIENDAEAPQDFRLLAVFQKIRLMAQDDPKKALPLLEAIARDENHPWRHIARFEAAVLQVHTNNNYTAARDHLNVLLKEEELPASLDRKARSLDILYKLQDTTLKTEIKPEADKNNTESPKATENNTESGEN